VRVARGQARFDLIDIELFPKFDPLLKAVEGKLVLNEAIEPHLQEIIAERAPALMLGSFWGNQHFFMSTANFPRRLDFVLPDEPNLALDPQAELVPYDALHAFVLHHFSYCEQAAALLKRLSAAPLLLIPAPAPVKDLSAFARRSSSADIDRLVAEHGPTPALLRYKFWRLAANIHDSIATALAAELLPLPAGTIDEVGFRRPEFHHTDWLHANTAYGELVLRQIDARLAAI